MKKETLSLGMAAVFLAAFHASAAPGPLHSAKVTEIRHEVRLQEKNLPAGPTAGLDPSPYRDPTKAPTRQAAVGDLIQGGRLLRTGKDSRAELLFNDNTIARLGANSIFTFRRDSRNVHLSSGFVLLHTPKGNGGASVTTPTATAAVLGTTIMLSVLADGSVKLVNLEGTSMLSFQGQTQTLQPGQLCIYTPGQGISLPTTINLKRLVETSAMLKSFRGSLGSERLIQEAIDAQQLLLSSGQLSITGDEKGLQFVTDSGAASAIQSQSQPPPSNSPPSPPSGNQGGGPDK